MKFYLDEHIPSALADGLRRHGVDVLTVQEAGRVGEADEEQMSFAREQSRVIVTFDDDFLLLDSHGVAHAGIAFASDQRRTIGELIQSLLLMDGAMEPKEMENHVEFI